MPIMNSSTDALADRLLKKHGNKPFDIYPAFQELTLDVITKVRFFQNICNQKKFKVAFGYKGGEEINPFLDDCREVFAPNRRLTSTLAILIASEFCSNLCETPCTAVFPDYGPLVREGLRFIKPLVNETLPQKAMEEKLTEAVNERRNVSVLNFNRKTDESQAKIKDQDRTDFIDLFLEAETDDKDDMTEIGVGKNVNSKAALDMRSMEVEKRLSTDEIVQNCVLFLLAGYDTTSNTLAYT